MNQEDKDLLLQDLCTRLPYGVICNDSRHGDSRITEIDIVEETVYCYDFDEYVELDKIKPYLRPMSSMTEDENKEAKENGCIIYWDTSPEDKGLLVFASPKGFDWLNKKMFDYRGLIPMGLALEAPKGMYNSDNK